MNLDLSLVELGAKLRSREIRAIDLAEEALGNHRLGAYRTTDPDHTRAMAEAADAAFDAGLDLGPLQGIPVSVKDNYGVPGFPTYVGSPKRLPERFEVPGPLIKRLMGQLAVVTGKTHTVEFAFGGLGTNPHYDVPKNPWDPTYHRAPGGSSSGAGVSVCESSAVVALGTDTAGSVRTPASWTGNVGLKVTRGLWPTSGIVPLSPTLDTPGFITRTVPDMIQVYQALHPSGPVELPSAVVRGLRIARCDELFHRCAPGVQSTVDNALTMLESGGARILSQSLPEVAMAGELFRQGGPVSAELDFFLSTELPSWQSTLDANVKARIGDAHSMPTHEYLRRRAAMKELAASIDKRLSMVDIVVSPTVPISPPKLSEIVDENAYRTQNLLCLRNTSVVNYLGLCAITLPVGLDILGLPVGCQLIGRAFHEPKLLSLARTLEIVWGTGAERLGAAPRLV